MSPSSVKASAPKITREYFRLIFLTTYENGLVETVGVRATSGVAINMAAARQHGEVSGRADSHVMANDSGLLTAYLYNDSANHKFIRIHTTNKST